MPNSRPNIRDVEEIRQSGNGGHEEHWWSLAIDEDTGEFFIRHVMSYVPIRGKNQNEDELTPLRSMDPIPTGQIIFHKGISNG